MTPKEVWTLARQLMNLHGLHDWRFGWDRAKRRAGCCKHSQKLITLSGYYVTRNTDKPDDVKDTILHEIAHALAGPRKGHGAEWKAICRKIGARPVRCYDSEKIVMPKGKWVAVCGDCKKVFHRHRRPKVGNGRYYFCPKCGPGTGILVFACRRAS